jgi:hypothetical protein
MNMVKQQNKDWRNWGDHPLVAIIGTLAALISIIVFVTGKEHLSKFWSNSQTGKFQEEKSDTSQPPKSDSAKSSISKSKPSKIDSVGSAVNSTTSNISVESKSYRDSAYVESKFESTPNKSSEEKKTNVQKVIAVLIREKTDAAFDDELGSYFSSMLKVPEHKRISVTQLEKVFKTKSKFNTIYENGLLHNQRSQDYQGFLLLGIKEKYFRPSDVSGDLVVADVTIRFNVISLPTGELIKSFSMSSRKPGVSERQAYQYAIDELRSDSTALINSIQQAN